MDVTDARDAAITAPIPLMVHVEVHRLILLLVRRERKPCRYAVYMPNTRRFVDFGSLLRAVEAAVQMRRLAVDRAALATAVRHAQARLPSGTIVDAADFVARVERGDVTMCAWYATVSDDARCFVCVGGHGGAGPHVPSPPAPRRQCPAKRTAHNARRRVVAASPPPPSPVQSDGRRLRSASPYPPYDLSDCTPQQFLEEAVEVANARPEWDEEVVQELLRLGARPPLVRVGRANDAGRFVTVECTFQDCNGRLVEGVVLPRATVVVLYPHVHVPR